ncbi:MAG: LytTR family DNA-binding domain-containing protein [Candidatus Enterenecus sp.]
MKVTVEEDRALAEPEVVIRCRCMDEGVVRLAELLRLSDARLTGVRDGATHILDPGQVLYIDTADRATFLYTAAGVYETPLRLYELEERLAGREFLRVSKSAIINFDQVRALRPDFGGRMRLTMSNGEVVMANRQYVPDIKARLGLGKER